MMDADGRKYKFDWSMIASDMGLARPSLGDTTSVEVYRLLQFSLRDILESRYGAEKADDLFRQAGALAGRKFFEKYCQEAKGLDDLTRIVQKLCIDKGIGIVRFEAADTDSMQFQLTVDEDLDCSGLPDTMEQICVYDEGFLKGIFDAFTGKNFTVQEVDCWRSGARTCRFRASVTA